MPWPPICQLSAIRCASSAAPISPCLSPPCPIRRALQFPAEGAVDAAALTAALLTAAAARGAQIWLGVPVMDLAERAGRVIGVTTAQGQIPADLVILATGCATPALLAPLGLTLPMLSHPGAILRSRPVAARLTHLLAAPGQEVRQDAAFRLLAPCAASHQGDAAETMTDLPGLIAAATLARLSALLGGVEVQFDHLALAHRPVPGDELPVIGAAMEGLALAVMHSGATLAPLVAGLLADEVFGGSASQLPAEFRPARLLQT